MKKGRPSTALLRSNRLYLDQVQTIAPLELSQVFADCECDAVADQLWGGPAMIAALMVTFCDGVKPFSGVAVVAVPAK